LPVFHALAGTTKYEGIEVSDIAFFITNYLRLITFI